VTANYGKINRKEGIKMDKAFNFRGKFTSDIAKKVFEDFGNKKVNLLIRELPKGTPDNPIILHGTTDEMREQIRKSLGYDENWQPKADDFDN
jgi:hypothetical protein